jgi:hypothetical protein
MLQFLEGKASHRKLRLFACACCRRAWDLLINEQTRKAVEASERYADRLITTRQLAAARGAAQRAARKVQNAGRPYPDLLWAHEAAHLVATSCLKIPKRAALMAWLPGEVARHVIGSAVTRPVPRLDERKQLAALLRDVIGNPFRPPQPVPPAVLAWNHGTAPRIAQSIYDDRAFGRLPVLADALEDAGCADPDLLGHLREPGPHARGCWALDLLLGKE